MKKKKIDKSITDKSFNDMVRNFEKKVDKPLPGGYFGVNKISDATYTLQASDAGKLLATTNDDDVVITIPTEDEVNFAIGTRIFFVQYGSGIIELSSDATINAFDGSVVTGGQYEPADLVKIDSDEWCIM